MAKIIDLITNAGQVDVKKGIVEEVTKSVPELDFFDAEIIDGTTISTLARTSLPTVAFRNIGEPVSNSRSQFAERTATLKMLSGRAEISDAEIAKNPLMTKDEQCVDEAVATMIAGGKKIASQIWYGKNSDNKGFDGAVELVDAAMVTKAGAGDDTNTNTSVFFVCNGAKTACGLVFSRNSKIVGEGDIEFNHGDIQIKGQKTITIGEGETAQTVTLDDYVLGVEPGMIGDLTSYTAFLVSNKKRLARLANVTATTGLTDDMLTDCIEAFAQANDGKRPDAIFMSFNARKMLRKSRRLTIKVKNVDANIDAPTPTDIDGIPIIATNAILDTEAKVA